VEQIRERYEHYLPLRDPELPLGICHGDLFRDNVLWEAAAASSSSGPPSIAALLDFESVSWGGLAYDLMVTTLAWCFLDALDHERAAALFQGYQALRPLGARELAALPVEGAFACLRFATTRITDFEQRAAAGAAPARDFRRFLARLAALEGGALDPLRAAFAAR
jgi:homoserine kinase type II